MAKPLEVDQQWLERIANQVNGLQYGQVTITVHDGRIVQIDRTERTRYDGPSQKQQSPSEQQSKPREQASNGETLRIVQ
ncbi:YezD family protein [Paenibacillus arenilitoris]|uniref:YezD family protein n=1 Tax=Paenibacillus arenilitoris TaxID=2772299 RepID=A0A927CHE6_9BACL|nr:YezD family protein [Paenibacillus arenilitoris]MBD2868139.1 YezD family protein [Paenibacillus arenilitoris]